MSHNHNILAPGTDSWIDDGGTLNPAPAVSRDKDARDTAEGCRERATADLTRALATSTVNGRQVFEKSAASWTKRADLLQRIETGIEARLNAPEPASNVAGIELTSAEIAEDAAFLRL